jgi:hypothetical protein
MARIPTGDALFFGKPETRDCMKRQTEHVWWTALDGPTMEELQTMHDEEGAKKWDNNPLGDWS